MPHAPGWDKACNLQGVSTPVALPLLPLSSYPLQPTPDLLLPLEFLLQQTALASLFLPAGPLDHSLLHAALSAYPYLVQHRKVGKLLNQALSCGMKCLSALLVDPISASAIFGKPLLSHREGTITYTPPLGPTIYNPIVLSVCLSLLFCLWRQNKGLRVGAGSSCDNRICWTVFYKP